MPIYTIPPALIHAGAFTPQVIQELMATFHHTQSPTLLAAAGAIDNHTPGLNIITLASAGAFTLAAPTAGAAGVGDDGNLVEIVSITAFAHTITVTSFQMGIAGSVGRVTFAAFKGCALRLMAYQGSWYLLAMNGGTCS